MSFVLPALTIGLGALRIKPTRGFYPSTTSGIDALKAQATIEEIHRDDLEITEHPVEFGAPVADHAFLRPAEVIIRCGWSNSPSGNPGLLGAALGLAGVKVPIIGKGLAAVQTIPAALSLLSGNGVDQIKAIYKHLLELQATRIPFDIYTGKRIYRNMLFKSLATTTDLEHANSLLLLATCRQVLIVRTQTVQAPVNASAQRLPQKTAPVIAAGQKQLIPSTLGSGFFGVP